ncbi:hypothetical protein K502DRAFT_333437 [Neoconidiobolus thromboides FSU 785]|nr:hypothetical protein K502DRAFT_333437 [Neoconidiobolus thromboides FSU 785]
MKIISLVSLLLVNIPNILSSKVASNAELKIKENIPSKELNSNGGYRPRYDDDDDDDDDRYDSGHHYNRPRPDYGQRSRCPRGNERCNRGNSGAFCYDGFNCPPCWTYNRGSGNWDCYDYNYETGRGCIFDWIDVRNECGRY